MPINPTLPVDGESDWDVTLNAALDVIVDGVNDNETAIGGKLDTSAAAELIRDTMGTALVAGTNVTITPNDGSDTITIAASGGGGGAVDSVNGATGVVVLDQDDVLDGTTYKQYSATEKTKLAGVATSATANDTDANLKARANHTGTQTASTISDFDAAANTAVRRMVPFSQGGTLTTGTGVFKIPNATGSTRTIHSVWATVGTAPTGASILVDANLGGTTIFTTQSNRPTIAVSTDSDQSGTPDVTSWTAGTLLTIDIDQIGSTVAGANLVVTVVYS